MIKEIVAFDMVLLLGNKKKRFFNSFLYYPFGLPYIYICLNICYRVVFIDSVKLVFILARYPCININL